MKLRLLLFFSLGFFALALAADWPQWRGPQRDGISKETGLLQQWPKGGPKLVWQVKDIGFGYSTPAVVGDHLYLVSNKGSDNEFVHALSAKDGKQVWSTRLGRVGPNQKVNYPGARSTPTVDGDVLYALGSDGDLACVERENGKVRWKKSLRKDFGGQPGAWAYSESPLIDGDVLVCTPGGEKATMVALNKKNGAVLWKSPFPEADEAGYASFIIVDAAGVKQYVQFLEKGLAGVDAKTGKLLWRYSRTAKGSPANIPTPVAHGNLVYSAAGRTGGAAVKLQSKGDTITAEEVYFSRNLPNSIGGAVVVNGHLYGTNNSGLVCAEFATGKVKWQAESGGAGSVCYAEGRLYVHGENGDVALVEATPAAYHEKGRFTLPDQPKRGKSKAWAYPVVANGRLYIRDLDVLWCYDVKDEKGGKTGQTTLRILLPTKGARVLIDGKSAGDRKGTERQIVAPSLAKGKKVYEVMTTWRTNNYTKFYRTQKLAPKPGATVVVDLRKQDPDNPDHIEIRFVPTPDDVVARMCKLGNVAKDDIVYDLGCGDGRIVITAVADFKAKKGVGVDLDPDRIKESVASAKEHKVTDRVEFRVGDVLKIKDLSSASVVMLYMGEDVNLRLRPILQKTLKPGSRIVSHAFSMGDWKPDKVETFEGEDGDEYVIYLWTIPKPKKE